MDYTSDGSKSRYQPQWITVGKSELWSDISTGTPRILVPTCLQRTVFDSTHRIAHPGSKAGYKILKNSYWWPGMRKEPLFWAKSCFSCQVSKIHRHTKSPLENLPPPTRRFSHIHVDLVGPLPQFEGKNMLVTIIDCWTSWPEAFPLSTTGDAASAQACAKIIIREWIPRFGVPEVITTDRGSQFKSDLWISLCRLMGIHRDMTTAYHPQHNGKLERWHRCLKNSLRSRLLGRQNWVAELPWVLLGLRAAPNLDTGVSPALMVTGQLPALPGHLVIPRDDIPNHSAFSERLSEAKRAQPFIGNPWHGGESSLHYTLQNLAEAAEVLVRRDRLQSSLAPKFDGPFRVVSRSNKQF